MKPSSFINQVIDAKYLEKGKNLTLTIIEKMFEDIIAKQSPLFSDARMIVKRLKASTDNGYKVTDLKIDGYIPSEEKAKAEDVQV